ncbi:hypothetical protein G9O61_00g019490 [Vairimorpha ceranae]|nr:hypothetical protein G9O61_00g019490 [Vairimorpha ceranae]
MSTNIFDAALGLIKLSNINKAIKIKSQYKDELNKAVLNRVFELTSTPSLNTQLDLSILLHLDLNIIKNWFRKLREQKNKKIKTDLEGKECEKSTDIPVTVIMQIVCIVRDSLEGRSKMRRSKRFV